MLPGAGVGGDRGDRGKSEFERRVVVFLPRTTNVSLQMVATRHPSISSAGQALCIRGGAGGLLALRPTHPKKLDPKFG